MNGELWMAQQRRKMGAKKFDEWMRSQEIRKYTNFEDETELKNILKKPVMIGQKHIQCYIDM